MMIPLALAAVAAASPASAKTLRVVTTLTDSAAIAREVAGDRARVEALAPPVANAHFVDAKPSFIVRLIKADLFIENGLDLETGWAPLLVQGARRPELQPGQKGHLIAAEAVEPIEIPSEVSRAMGDVHPGGNPHFMPDPENARRVARLVAQRLSELSPGDAPAFRENLARFEARLSSAAAGWRRSLAPLKGTRFVSYHRDWNYFARAFGLVPSGELEPKPGIPPTPSHTAALIERMKAEKVRLIFVDPWYERRSSESIARATGAALADLALYPGIVPGTEDYFSWMEHNVRTLLEASR